MSKKIIQTNKVFDTVKFFRSVKEKIAEETKGMSFAELKEYISKRKIKHGDKKLPVNQVS